MSLLRPQMGPFCLRSEALPSRLDLRNVATATSCTDRTAVCVVRSCLYIYYTDSPTRSTDSRRSSIQVRKCWQACHESAGSHESRGRVDTRRAGCVLEHRSVHYTQWGHYCALRRSPRPLRVIAPPTHRWNAAFRQPATEEVKWTRNAFFSLETAWYGPYTIPKDDAP